MTRLLRYKQVRAMFDWRSNFPIREAVAAGHLTRICTGAGANSYRITAKSAEAFLASKLHHNSAAELADLARAAAQTAKMKSARRIPLPDGDVLLDPEEITRNAEMGVASRSPETWDHYRNEPRVAKSALPNTEPVPVVAKFDWREANRKIEAERPNQQPETSFKERRAVRAARQVRIERHGF